MLKNNSDTIKTITGCIRGFMPFPRGISPKVNVIARMRLELTYSEAAVQHFSHCTTGTPKFNLNIGRRESIVRKKKKK